MKKIIKYLLLFTFIVAISCDNEDTEQFTISLSSSGQITAPDNGDSYVLNFEEELMNTILTLTWNAADYGVPTEINYLVEFAKAGTDFANAYEAGSTLNTFLSWNIQELNTAATSAGLTPFVKGELDIRVVSTVGAVRSSPQYSDPISVFVTPFSTDLPLMAVPGQYQGWKLDQAPFVAASAYGATDYEGYVWLTKDPVDDQGFVFIGPDGNGEFVDNWDIKWGDDGSNSGVLKSGGDNIKLGSTDTDGLYFITADTDELTYSTAFVNWGIIGEATPTGWDSDTDLVYDPATNTLSVDIVLSPGAFKFRGNDEWGAFDLGTKDDDGHLQYGGDLTFDGAGGNYRVVLDLSNPREYKYSLTAL